MPGDEMIVSEQSVAQEVADAQSAAEPVVEPVADPSPEAQADPSPEAPSPATFVVPASLGAMVGYVLPGGEIRAAIVVRVWSPEMAQLMVFTDGQNDARYVSDRQPGLHPDFPQVPPLIWRTSVHYAPYAELRENTWHWPHERPVTSHGLASS